MARYVAHRRGRTWTVWHDDLGTVLDDLDCEGSAEGHAAELNAEADARAALDAADEAEIPATLILREAA